VNLAELRRLAEAATPGPTRTGKAVLDWRDEVTPSAVLALLDRLAAAEALLVESQGALYTIHDNAYIDGLTDRIAAHLAGKDGVK